MGNIRTEGHTVRANSKDAGDLQSLGDISMKRGVKEYKALNTGNITQFLGSGSTDPVSMSVLYDPANTTGAKELENAFNNATTIPYEIELADTLGVNGTTFSWTGVVVSEFKLTPEEDGAWLASFSVAFNGLPSVTPAA